MGPSDIMNDLLGQYPVEPPLGILRPDDLTKIDDDVLHQDFLIQSLDEEVADFQVEPKGTVPELKPQHPVHVPMLTNTTMERCSGDTLKPPLKKMLLREDGKRRDAVDIVDGL